MKQHSDLQGFFEPNDNFLGAEGLVFIGDEVLVYRRDYRTTNHPGEISLPGGGPFPGETPYENFRREVKEEFNLDVEQSDISYVRCYPSHLDPRRVAYYPVAKLPGRAKSQIRFGNEGSNWMLMPLQQYLELPDAWKVLQDRAREYAQSIQADSVWAPPAPPKRQWANLFRRRLS